jgi:hypothetical protein
MTKRLRGAAADAATAAAVIAVAGLGLVWISIWAVGALARHVGDWAPLMLGLLLCAPALIYALVRMTKASAAPAVRPLLRRDSALAADAADAAKRFFQESPIAALGVAALAGLLAVRAPEALGPLMHLFDDKRD